MASSTSGVPRLDGGLGVGAGVARRGRPVGRPVLWDPNNTAVAGVCGEAAESSTVDRQATSFKAHAVPQQATVGQGFADVATLIG